MRRIRGMTLLLAGAAAVAGGVAYVPGLLSQDEATAAAQCDYPAQVLDLRSWKIQLPIGAEEDPDEVKQPQLATYKVDPWFVPTPNCDGVQFRSAVNGVTTGGSNYPRSELREMNSDGSDEAAWSSTDGTHTMTIEQTVTHLPNDKPHLVVGQIHGGDDDVSVFRVEGNSLYVTNGDDPHYRLVTDNFQLNTRFQVKFVVSQGTIHAYYNGDEVATLDADFSTGYFKAGAYTQANCERSDPCDESNYGETIIHRLTIGDDGSSQPDPPPPADDQLPVTNVTASGHDGNVPANTRDGDRTTRWSDEGDGVWIQYDLGQSRTVGSVALSWHKGDQRKADFRIQTSADGSNWTTRLSGSTSGTTLQPQTYDIPDTAARYVRVVGFGNTENEWTSITETAIYPPN